MRSQSSTERCVPAKPITAGQKVWVALTASGVAGFVDALGFLALDRVYTAHMSGNSVFVAVNLVKSNGLEVLRHACPVLGFVAGLLTTAILAEIGGRSGMQSVTAVVLGLESLALGAATGLSWTTGTQAHDPHSVMAYVVIVLITLAMGLQNAAITRIGPLRVFTTHVTGTLVRFASSLSHFLFWVYDRGAGVRGEESFGHAAPRQGSFRRACLTGGLWFAFVAGGAAGAWVHQRWGLSGLPLAAIPLAVLIVVDLVRPIGAAEEEQQVEQ